MICILYHITFSGRIFADRTFKEDQHYSFLFVKYVEKTGNMGNKLVIEISTLNDSSCRSSLCVVVGAPG